jgi:hypothetical protein
MRRSAAVWFGTLFIAACGGGGAAPDSTANNGAAAGSTASSGTSSQLVITTALPSSASLGVALSPQPVVQLRDADGNAIHQAGIVVTAAASGSCVTLTNATATTDGNGQAAFAGLSIAGAALSRTLTFSSPGLTSAQSAGISLQWGPAVSTTSVSVTCFGAKGDGVTNDQPAIQQALDSLSNDGGIVTLPVGTFLLGSSAGGAEQTFPNGTPMESALMIRRDNLVLQGQGSASILQLAPHMKLRILTIDSVSGVTVEDLVADGNKTQRDASQGWPNGDVVDAMLHGYQTTALHYLRVEARNGLEDGLTTWMSTNPIVDTCYSHDNGFAAAANDGVFIGGSGASINHTTGGQVINTRIENNTGPGIWFAFNAVDSTAQGNTITGQLGTGITMGGLDTASGSGDNHGFTISNNVISGNGSLGYPALRISAAPTGTISGNQITDNHDGVRFEDETVGVGGPPSTGWTVTGNTISNTTSARTQTEGVYLAGHSGAALQTNTITNNGTSLANQVVIAGTGVVINADWQTVNTISYQP